MDAIDQEILTADEAAAFLRIGRNALYAAVAAKRIPHQRFGRRIVISKAALIQWLGLKKESAGVAPESTRRPEDFVRVPTPMSSLPLDHRFVPIGGRRQRAAHKQVLKEQVLQAIVQSPNRGCEHYAEIVGMNNCETGLILGYLRVDGLIARQGYGRAATWSPTSPTVLT